MHKNQFLWEMQYQYLCFICICAIAFVLHRLAEIWDGMAIIGLHCGSFFVLHFTWAAFLIAFTEKRARTCSSSMLIILLLFRLLFLFSTSLWRWRKGYNEVAFANYLRSHNQWRRKVNSFFLVHIHCAAPWMSKYITIFTRPNWFSCA